MKVSPSEPAPSLSASKRRVFTLVMVLIPVLFVLALEGGLRLAGYGTRYPLFVPVDNRPDYLYQNRDLARRYFSGDTPIPTSQSDFFKAEKDPNTLRIFVQGESSAAGFPFYYGGSFSRMLEQRLAQTFPDRQVEVINTAMAAISSYTLTDLADEIVEYQPDVVIVYTGHNEYYGALGVGSSQTLGQYPWLTRLYVKAVKFRTVQALRDLIRKTAGLFGNDRTSIAGSSTLMEQMVGRQRIPYGSGLYRAGLNQFEANLSELLSVYQKRGIPVLIGTVASNERDQAPFISGLSPETDAAAWRKAYEAARATDKEGMVDALRQAEALVEMDSLSADAWYLKAQILDRAGRYAEARNAYLAAKDRDELRFRAPEAVNAIIRKKAARYGATIVESMADLEQGSPGGIIGSNYMLEHLHPNVDGYFRLSDAFYRVLLEHQPAGATRLNVPAAAARREVLFTEVDSLAGMFRIRKLKGSWPFQPPGQVDTSLDRMTPSSRVEAIALQLYRNEKSWFEANEALQRYYESQGRLHDALKAALARIQEYPFIASSYFAAGNILVRERRYHEALDYFGASNDLDETALAHAMIGSILLQEGNRPEAIVHLERTLVLDPNNLQALYNLGGAYVLTRQYDKARGTINRLLSIAPNHPDARRLLAGIPPEK